MQKTKRQKTYQTVGNILKEALENVSLKDKKALLEVIDSKNEPSGYALFRKYKKDNFPLWRCETWFSDACILYLNMQKEDFREPVNNIHYDLLEKVGLTNKKK